MLVLFIYITRLASNEIFSPSSKIHGEVGRAKDLSASLYVCPSAWNNSAPTGRCSYISKFDIWQFFENKSRKFKFHYNLTRITGTLREDPHVRVHLWYLTIFLLEQKIFHTQICKRNPNIHFMFNNLIFSENRAVYEAKWGKKNIL